MKLTNNDKSFKVDRSYLLEIVSKARRAFESSKPEQKSKILKNNIRPIKRPQLYLLKS